MRRRDFIKATIGLAAGWPLAARAQLGERVRHIGLLVGLPEDDPDTKVRLAGFRLGLETLGWSEGRNVRIDYRFAPDGAHAQALAKELVALQPDVILSMASPTTGALQRETRTIPIVFVGVADPIGSGFVTSLAQPGGNITGFLLFEASITGKWLAMLRDMVPSFARATLVINPKTAVYYEFYLRAARAAASSLGVELVLGPIGNAHAEIERAFEAFAHTSNGGLLFPPDINTNAHRDLLIALTARYRLPAVYSDRLFVVAGGLMCYGTDRADQFRAAASYVDRILRGAKPADLPVQVPTKYETVINLKTAKALGLTVPPGLLVAADEVIE
ncbi:MAG TPA: ABC transporter substrate-binding protein [Acidobacteriota bacterium]|nr:ABC transporter substrate-binding protein [Acidobacteriota bacterium]